MPCSYCGLKGCSWETCEQRHEENQRETWTAREKRLEEEAEDGDAE